MKIRIKNDIVLDLSVFRPGNLPEDFTEATDAKVTLTCKGRTFIPSFTHEDNQVIVYFTASMQKELGFYTVTLQYNKPGATMPEGESTYTVDYCDAFKLVGRSCEADQVPENGIYSLALSMTVDRTQAAGTSDYEKLTNKPTINDVELTGDLSLEDLGIKSPDLSGFVPKEGYVPYSQIEKERLASVTQPTYFKWLDGMYQAVAAPPDFSEDIYQIINCAFIESNPIDNPQIKIGDEVFTLKINNQQPLKERISPEEICYIWFYRDEARMFGLDSNRATVEEARAGEDKNKYITPETLKVVTDDAKKSVSSQLASASSSVYSAAIAYVDSQIKDFEYLQLFINPADISTNQPTGNGVSVPLNMTTTEQLWFDKPFTIQADGTVDKNIYKLLLPFTSISTSRVTICRAVWSITTNGVEKIIFDKEFVLQNTTGDYDFAGDFIREYPADIPYKVGDTARLKLYGRVSSGTDTAYVLLGDSNRTAVLVRANPISQGVTRAYVDGAIPGLVTLTQEEYNELPDGKLTDGKYYFIV